MRQDFCVALEALLEVALVDQAGLELIELSLPLSAGVKGLKAYTSTTWLSTNKLSPLTP